MAGLIEDYGFIGDGETAALVSRAGSVDWLCLPRFDSDACFSALLGDDRHGFWRIAPEIAGWRVTRAYRPETLILETTFSRGQNVVRLTDFMPRRQGAPALVRIVTGVSGSVELRLEMLLRFNYGLVRPWHDSPDPQTMIAVVGPDQVVLRGGVPFTVAEGSVSADFTIGAGETITFTLCYASATEPPPVAPDPRHALAAEEAFWRDWVGRFNHKTDWPDPTLRSLITLKGLIHKTSGGLVAAATTSLPEAIGGKMNWDYRYCWLRDATFTIGALLNAGYHREAEAWRDWMLRAVAGQMDELRIMYRIDGGRHLQEWEAGWLPGYEGSSPVRIGNSAAAQEQLDVPGELIDAMYLMRRAGLPDGEQARTVERALVEQIERTWTDSGHGLWESRKGPKDYVYAKAMAWAGVDRFLKGAAQQGGAAEPGLVARLSELRTRIHRDICEHGYHRGRGHFVHEFGGSALDGSLLLLLPIGFLPANDERIVRTIDAIARDLTEDGLVLRKPRSESPHEGAFIACTCWLADCRAMQGREQEARALLERVLDLRNDLGLLSEEYDTGRKRLCGNFPQALTHLALLNTALGLSGPVLQRAGG